MNILFLELAEQEFYDSKNYYEEQQENLGDRFQSEISNALNRIKKFPTTFVKIKKDVRKCVVNKFPFNLLYSIEEDHIIILAVAHHHRKPDYWLDRLK